MSAFASTIFLADLLLRQMGAHSIGLHANPARLRILDQPGPSTSLDTRQLLSKQLLERLHAAVRLLNSFGKLPARRLPAARTLWRQVFPEQGMVDVPATVKIDQRLQRDLRRWRVGRRR